MLHIKYSRYISFGKFLGLTANIPSNRIPFEKYFSEHQLEEKEALEPFLTDLQKQFKDWHVAWAKEKEAVKLRWCIEWEKDSLQMRILHRLQHKSYRTDRYVLNKQIEGIAEAIRSRVRKRLPVVLDQNKIVQIFQNLQDPFSLISRLICCWSTASNCT